MEKLIGCFIACCFFFAEKSSGQIKTLKSPDGSIALKLQTGNSVDEPLAYQLFCGDKSVINAGKLKLNTGNTLKLQLQKAHLTKVRSQWKTVYGERKFIPENYNQLKLLFDSDEDSRLRLTLLLRVYNEGFAYQYTLHQKGEIVLKNESSAFGLPDNATAWVSSTAQGILTEKKIRDIKDVAERPLTIRLTDSLYLALGEAGLVDFARMKFTSDNAGGLLTKLDGETKALKELRSPWRYVLVGNSPADLLQKNYLLLNLNVPNQMEDTKWIQPGKVLREVTLTTTGAYRTIDFAAAHNIRYILFDAGWYGREDHDTSDASRVSLDPLRSKGPLDLHDVIRYGNAKGVGVILYVNRRALEKQLDSLLPLYRSWGVKGLKFGFVQVGSQRWTSWLHEAIRKCAQYHMIVDVHDEYRPTGYSRTYPNLLTQEGIRGDEESPFTEHSITSLFTRMIAGAADNTNCYFTSRVDKMGSHTAQMAKAVCIYSPLQFLYWYDHPKFETTTGAKDGEILEVPELNWYTTLPTTWDETRVLDGDMQDFATIARKKGSQWFVGSLNGTKPRVVQLPLQFLDKGKKYVATIYSHDTSLQTATHVRIKTMNVDAGSTLRLPIGSRDGIAVHIMPE
ncbi:glycoside hydrolase family 97 protein [Flavisolibacter ginsenosidimutans]|uniref:Glycoside hydrolase family 97 protein n=1 Tax=Flavisolibacter ginsenosidimutans TaxID=661481 RepID=A0A5B8UIE7_9BACT|nr:glycoside hydrolase family 97 protein [Flavisolibacter ginsenosidimutans]QEC56303.1 glycoside hydrolase family 97 protein [Flavisolibacter ginsenosidimutans]